jgi:hypothetical protein
MMSVLFAPLCVVIAVTISAAQIARMVQEMIQITVNALMDTISPINSVPSAISICAMIAIIHQPVGYVQPMQPLTLGQVYVRATKATGLTSPISTASSAPTSARPATQAVIALVASITPVVNLLNATV